MAKSLIGPQSGAQSKQILSMLAMGSLSMIELVSALKRAVKELIFEKHIEYIIPGKPNSRSQKYRLTQKGKGQIAGVK